MKILALGASGRTGSLFTRKALEEGHTVTAYVRNPDKAAALLGEHQNLIIVPGALNDAERLATVSSGQDVMVSILGQKATGVSIDQVHAEAPAAHYGGGSGCGCEALRYYERLRGG